MTIRKLQTGSTCWYVYVYCNLQRTDYCEGSKQQQLVDKIHHQQKQEQEHTFTSRALYKIWSMGWVDFCSLQSSVLYYLWYFKQSVAVLIENECLNVKDVESNIGSWLMLLAKWTLNTLTNCLSSQKGREWENLNSSTTSQTGNQILAKLTLFIAITTPVISIFRLWS